MARNLLRLRHVLGKFEKSWSCWSKILYLSYVATAMRYGASSELILIELEQLAVADYVRYSDPLHVRSSSYVSRQSRWLCKNVVISQGSERKSGEILGMVLHIRCGKGSGVK